MISFKIHPERRRRGVKKNITMFDKFENNPQELIKNNPLWKGDLIPLYPIEKNYFKLRNIKYDMNKLLCELKTIVENSTMREKAKGNDDWASITLKSKDGNDQSFLENTFLGTGVNNNYKYTPSINNCTYIKDILNEIPTDIYLVRVLKLKANSVIKFHTDNIVFQRKKEIIRCHIPIVTNENVKFQIGYPKASPSPGYNIWDADILHEKFLEPGYLWFTNVNTLHGVRNSSNIDRYHLVIDLKPTDIMLKLIYNV